MSIFIFIILHSVEEPGGPAQLFTSCAPRVALHSARNAANILTALLALGLALVLTNVAAALG